MGRLNSGQSFEEKNNKKDKRDIITLNEEETKLYRLTKSNTSVNKDILHKEENYLKKNQPKYEELFGDKGTKFCEEEEKKEKNENEDKKDSKKVGRVKFSTIVEYSRN